MLDDHLIRSCKSIRNSSLHHSAIYKSSNGYSEKIVCEVKDSNKSS